jgi:hypothetical protein
LHHLAGINKYLFLKDFSVAGEVRRSEKALLRMACRSRRRKNQRDGVAGTARRIAEKEMLKNRNRK